MIGMDYAEEPINRMVAIACPACGSRHCHLQATARKAGVVVGGVLGAIIAAGFGDAALGALTRTPMAGSVDRQSPPTLTEMIGGAILGFACGAIVGYVVGTDIDMNVLRIYQCRTCNFEFEA